MNFFWFAVGKVCSVLAKQTFNPKETREKLYSRELKSFLLMFRYHQYRED